VSTQMISINTHKVLKVTTLPTGGFTALRNYWSLDHHAENFVNSNLNYTFGNLILVRNYFQVLQNWHWQICGLSLPKHLLYNTVFRTRKRGLHINKAPCEPSLDFSLLKRRSIHLLCTIR